MTLKPRKLLDLKHATINELKGECESFKRENKKYIFDYVEVKKELAGAKKCLAEAKKEVEDAETEKKRSRSKARSKYMKCDRAHVGEKLPISSVTNIPKKRGKFVMEGLAYASSAISASVSQIWNLQSSKELLFK